MKQWIFIVAIIFSVSACQMGDTFFVDFENVQSAPGMFRVMSQRTSEVQSLADADSIMTMGGSLQTYSLPQPTDSTMRGPHRATSTTIANFGQNLLDFFHAGSAIELAGVYESTDESGNPITLSGKVILPANGKIKRCILVSHYTITSNIEAPSNCFSLEGILVGLGYALIIPDYIGYGVTADRIHPYLVMDVTARNVLDMYQAVIPFLKAANCAPEYDDIYLMGYSQGGATTMAVQYMIEHNNMDIKIRRVFAGGGPYDVKATYDRYVETDVTTYPLAVPIMMQGMVVGNKLDLDMSELMAPRIYANLDEWINSKRYATAQINNQIGTHVTHELLTPKGMDRTSEEVSELYKAMVKNSILSYSWKPKAPVFLLHSINDETVPYENAMLAKSKWQGSNIQYHLGYFGSHVNTCVYFIYMVYSLLVQEEKEKGGMYEF